MKHSSERKESSNSTSLSHNDWIPLSPPLDTRLEGTQASATNSYTSKSAPSGIRFKGRLTKGCRTLLVALAVVLVVIIGFFYWVAATLDPDIGISGLQARTVAYSASYHLSWSPAVKSARVSSAHASSGSGPIARVTARLRDETSVDQAAELLASIHRKADSSQVPLSVTLSWRLNGTDISVNFSCDDSPDNIRATTQRELALVGKAKSVTRGEPDGSIHADYGTVDTVPASIAEPTGPNFYKTFTLHNWNVTYSPTQDGSYSNPPITDLIAAARQAGPTGTIELSNGTLSVTGLVTDENKGLTPEAAAPVVHAVADCQAAGLTTLQLNIWALNTTSDVADPWLTFTCNNGAWTPTHESTRGQDEATILNKAAEL